MGLMDNVSSAVNRGTAAAGRSAEKLRLRSRLGEIANLRQNLEAQLGASLYEVTRANDELRRGRENLYDGIAAYEAECAQINQLIAALDAQAALETAEVAMIACAVCGARIRETDRFCSGCGTPAEKARASQAVDMPTDTLLECSACGTRLKPDYAFCMECGAPVRKSSGENEGMSATCSEEVSSEPRCPTCGVEVANSQAFCMECGAPLLGAER